ncbi:MAG: DNA repair protein RecO [Halioglobus sp.]|nr:DNA repair protein RecO [Halioglobus sp.]
MRVNLQPAYVIHSRPYRDTSVILEVFTAEYGRISLVARGTRRQTRRGSKAALLQPFFPLLLSFFGRAELKTLSAIEPVKGMPALRGERLFSGLYMNELLVRLLHRNDAHPALFSAYDCALKALAGIATVDTVLRSFEITLLDELGYGLNLSLDGASGERVNEASHYHYDPELGLVAGSGASGRPAATYSGADLLAMESGEFEGPVRLPAKLLLREVLAAHLGDMPLHSRELFRLKRALSSKRSDAPQS